MTIDNYDHHNCKNLELENWIISIFCSWTNALSFFKKSQNGSADLPKTAFVPFQVQKWVSFIQCTISTTHWSEQKRFWPSNAHIFHTINSKLSFSTITEYNSAHIANYLTVLLSLLDIYHFILCLQTYSFDINLLRAKNKRWAYVCGIIQKLDKDKKIKIARLFWHSRLDLHGFDCIVR